MEQNVEGMDCYFVSLWNNAWVPSNLRKSVSFFAKEEKQIALPSENVL